MHGLSPELSSSVEALRLSSVLITVFPTHLFCVGLYAALRFCSYGTFADLIDDETASTVLYQTTYQILYISHAWARGRNGTDAVPHGPDDPGKQQYRAVERFLRTPLGKTFTHIYLDCACISPIGDKGRAAALANSATALIIASDMLLVPQTVVLSDGRACTDLRECLTR
jgi:hypothetical protein